MRPEIYKSYYVELNKINNQERRLFYMLTVKAYVVDANIFRLFTIIKNK